VNNEPRRMRLTDSLVRRLRPEVTEYTVWDTKVAGLGVRVRASGNRSFVWHGQANGSFARKTIGPAALKTVEDARRDCVALRNATAPQTARDNSAVPLFGAFVADEWAPAYRQRCAPSSRRSVDSSLRRRLIPAFGRTRLDRIRRADVERWFDSYSETAPGGANKALQLLSQIMRAAAAAGHCGTNPAQGIKKNRRRKLSRFLSADEIDRLHRVLDRLVEERPSRGRQADIIRLLLLTGCRQGEIVQLEWSEVHGGALRLADTKTGPRTVWLNGAAQAIMSRQPRGESPFVFPSFHDPAKPHHPTLRLWYRARKQARIEDARLHDLRHTFASQAVARGVPLSTVAKLLGHADAGMTFRYAHVGDSEVEAAAERVGKLIEAAMANGKLPGDG